MQYAIKRPERVWQHTGILTSRHCETKARSQASGGAATASRISLVTLCAGIRLCMRWTLNMGISVANVGIVCLRMVLEFDRNGLAGGSNLHRMRDDQPIFDSFDTHFSTVASRHFQQRGCTTALVRGESNDDICNIQRILPIQEVRAEL